MKKLQDKPNTLAPGGDYPYGDLVDNPGNNTGTPVNRLLLGDLLRNIEKIMNDSGVTPNGLDDNEANGYQILEAMKATIKGYQSTHFILNPSVTGNEVMMLQNDLGLAFTQLDGSAGIYAIRFADLSVIDNKTKVFLSANQTPSVTNVVYDFKATPQQNDISIISNDEDGSPITLPDGLVVEVRKYI